MAPTAFSVSTPVRHSFLRSCASCSITLSRRVSPASPCIPRASLSSGTSDSEDPNDDIPEAARRRIGKDPRDLLRRLDAIPVDLEPKESPDAKTFASETTGLAFLINGLPKSLVSNAEKYLSSPSQLLVTSGLAILFGFFSSTSATTIIGSVADWDPLAAFVLIIWTESFTRFYYRTELRKRSRVLQLINAFKIGLIYGMTVDAFKLST